MFQQFLDRERLSVRRGTWRRERGGGGGGAHYEWRIVDSSDRPWVFLEGRRRGYYNT